MRGENIWILRHIIRCIGSPPLARGKLFLHGVPLVLRRITPACAGKTKRRYWEPASRRDHPRLRGENKETGLPVAYSQGSPPLARGKPSFAEKIVSAPRITPACAGKTSYGRGSAIVWQDHPRLRGENLTFCIDPLAELGSPPLARGKHLPG